MSDSVLDLIDHALDAHGDAMRWSPDAPDPTPPEPSVDLVEAFGVALTEWQRATLAGLSRLSVAFGEFDIVVREVSHHVVRMSKIQRRSAEVARQARLRRMRHLYRQRRR